MRSKSLSCPWMLAGVVPQPHGSQETSPEFLQK